MPSKIQNDPVYTGWRSPVIFILLLFMMTALFFSRALLSVGMIAFVLVSFLHPNLINHFRNFLASPLLWGMSLLFFFPLLSGIWSEDTNAWREIIRIKLPLLFLPLAFAGPIVFSKKQWEWLGYAFITLITGATIWSLFQYTANITLANEGYLRAKIFLTPLDNDHVRFSWLVAIAILLTAWTCIQQRKKNIILSLIMGVGAAWLIVFLHILAARTGLFSFYILSLGTAIWLILRKMKWRQALLLLGLLVILPVTAYYTLPSFQNRVKYISYEFDFFKNADYRPGYNDGVRIISIHAGLNLVKQQPFVGAGFGDILNETNKWYEKKYPQMITTDRIYPSSEGLVYGAGCGIPGLLVFLFVMAIPFFIKTNQPLLWALLNATAAFSFLFDIGLEVQFGVFAYCFIVLWWYKWLSIASRN